MLLCLIPRCAYPPATCPPAIAVKNIRGHINCTAECAKRGLLPVPASGAANNKKFMCAFFHAVQEGEQFYYGTWSGGYCRYRNLFYYPDSGTSHSDNYRCGCLKPNTTVQWKQNALCASGPEAAAQDPAVCRVTKVGGGDWQLGTFKNSTCYFSEVPFGPGGAPVAEAYGVGGTYKVQVGCILASAAPGGRRRLAGLEGAKACKKLGRQSHPGVLVGSSSPGSQSARCARPSCTHAACQAVCRWRC